VKFGPKQRPRIDTGQQSKHGCGLAYSLGGLLVPLIVSLHRYDVSMYTIDVGLHEGDARKHARQDDLLALHQACEGGLWSSRHSRGDRGNEKLVVRGCDCAFSPVWEIWMVLRANNTAEERKGYERGHYDTMPCD
jgi:hypothetical protein